MNTLPFLEIYHLVLSRSQELQKIWILYTFLRSQKRELSNFIERANVSIKKDGIIWVSWPKKASNIKTDFTEDVIREVCLPFDLVDIKVCALDETWSGLKLVIRKEKR